MDLCAGIFDTLPVELYNVIFTNLDAASLRATDATCKSFQSMNRSLCLYRVLGAAKFAGMEVDERSMFEKPISSRSLRSTAERNPAVMANPTPQGAGRVQEEANKEVRRKHQTNWKIRYAHFCRDVYEFRAPFDPLLITNVLTPDEVAYTKARLRADFLAVNPEVAIYMEFDVRANADNLSLALVDFDEGGKSSVTFSPDTGAVIKETKVQESPRRVQGSYIQPVKPNFTKFEGKMGMYIHNSSIAFYRKYNNQAWETTGFCVKFDWASGKRLTPCLAFRDEGKYCTNITNVSQTPPFEPHWHTESFDQKNWEELNWEGEGEED